MNVIIPHTRAKFHDPCLNRYREILPEDIGGRILPVFRDNFRLEAASHVISGVVVEYSRI